MLSHLRQLTTHTADDAQVHARDCQRATVDLSPSTYSSYLTAASKSARHSSLPTMISLHRHFGVSFIVACIFPPALSPTSSLLPRHVLTFRTPQQVINLPPPPLRTRPLYLPFLPPTGTTHASASRFQTLVHISCLPMASVYPFGGNSAWARKDLIIRIIATSTRATMTWSLETGQVLGYCLVHFVYCTFTSYLCMMFGVIDLVWFGLVFSNQVDLSYTTFFRLLFDCVLTLRHVFVPSSRALSSVLFPPNFCPVFCCLIIMNLRRG